MTITDDVVTLLNLTTCGEAVTADDATNTAVTVAVDQVMALAKAYTRGRGFGDNGPNADISAVIVTAAARLVSNPRQFGVELPAGAQANRVFRGGFTGWSLAELAALNRYRVRAQ
jgi:hypothetical protein